MYWLSDPWIASGIGNCHWGSGQHLEILFLLILWEQKEFYAVTNLTWDDNCVPRLSIPIHVLSLMRFCHVVPWALSPGASFLCRSKGQALQQASAEVVEIRPEFRFPHLQFCSLPTPPTCLSCEWCVSVAICKRYQKLVPCIYDLERKKGGFATPLGKAVV